MADKVQADYGQLGQIASEFSNQSQAVQDLVQSIRNSFQPLQDKGWIGKGSQAFFDVMQSDIFPAIQRLQDAFDKASSTTNQIANHLQQAENDSQQLFRGL